MYNAIEFNRLMIGNSVTRELMLKMEKDRSWLNMDLYINRSYHNYTKELTDADILWYPTKLFKSRDYVTGITCNGIGHYIVLWDSGECLLVLDCICRDIVNDGVGRLVGNVNLNKSIEVEDLLSAIPYKPLSLSDPFKLTKKSHEKLLAYLEGVHFKMVNHLNDITNINQLTYEPTKIGT